MDNSEKKNNAILVVDDEEGIRTQLKWALASEYRVLLAANEEQAIQVLENENPNLVILDIALATRTHNADGLQLLQKILAFNPKTKVVMITGNEKRALALQSIELGAYDFYQKPINMEELKITLKRALYIQKLELENEALFLRLQEKQKFADIIGSCPKMLEVFSIIKRISSTDATALIYGESGTGKELVARAIHFQSPRNKKPFVTINCGAIPENLLESELFGHEKGSFTGAHIQRKGKLEVANGGTVFLDEIGELSPALQVKILRFLQEKEIERVGGRTPIQLDVRVIAATNRDLNNEIETGRFRSDLYYRLSVITINLPPLRERGDDVILLANSFLHKFAREYGKSNYRFDVESLKLMQQYHWPGNVRELENKVKRAVIMAEGNIITPEDLGLSISEGTAKKSLRELVTELEKKTIAEALQRNKGNISQTARELKITRTTLYDLLKKYNIKPKKMLFRERTYV
ncbi:PEP-CTERM-box response regulator transcription factor [candidate division KSB1 bacterium]|nr:MAG: PEP-CTERM-box response regulator transcription factor [candidate division KSB1 bacterium]